MRLVPIILTLCFLPAFVSAQKLDDFFLSKTHEEGTLYHLKEIELDSKEKVDLAIDYTYLRTQNADTVRVMLMLKSKAVKGKPKSILLAFNEQEILWDEDEIQLLYVDKEKKKWATRVEVSMKEKDFIQLLNEGQYDLTWTIDEVNIDATLPKKYVENYREFAQLLKYNN